VCISSYYNLLTISIHFHLLYPCTHKQYITLNQQLPQNYCGIIHQYLYESNLLILRDISLVFFHVYKPSPLLTQQSAKQNNNRILIIEHNCLHFVKMIQHANNKKKLYGHADIQLRTSHNLVMNSLSENTLFP